MLSFLRTVIVFLKPIALREDTAPAVFPLPGFSDYAEIPLFHAKMPI